MTAENRPIGRRTFLRWSLAGAAVVGAPGLLSACNSSNGSSGGVGGTGTKTAANPFGVKKGGSVDAVIFNGGYKTDYVQYAGNIMTKQHGGKFNLTPQTKISQTLQPKFMGGTPPDLVDDSGADLIPLTSLVDQCLDLTQVVEAKNLEGTAIKDTLYPHVLDLTTFDGKLVGLNYALTVYATWYSKTLFDKEGWKPPATWDDALALGAAAKKKGKYLYCFGKEAANYYWTMLVDAAIKDGGDEVRVALGNLEKNSWSHPAVQGAFNGMKKVIDAHYVKPGGAGTQFTQAQAQWSLKEQAILYPSGSWIEGEMKDQTAKNFKMTGATAPSATSSPAMGPNAVRGSSAETYLVPAKAKNGAAGLETLRIMLSKDAATNFAKTRLALPIVRGVVPANGFGSTAMVSQLDLIQKAGSKMFSYNFTDIYGAGDATNAAFQSFLGGSMSVADLTKTLQDFHDKVRENKSVKKLKVT